MLRLDKVDKYFGGQKVLNQVSFTLEPGQVLSLIGPSGAGKSTIMRAINKLETIDSGSISLGEDYLYENGQARDSKNYSKKLGMVFQNYNLFPHLTVLENISLALVEVYNLKEDQANSQARLALKMLRILDKEANYPFQLSGGERQRVAIARAYVLRPSIICLDEPTSALDPESISYIEEIIASLKKENIGVLIISHDMKFAKRVSDRILFLEGGKISTDTSERIKDFMDR